jgi:hypothetical protein
MSYETASGHYYSYIRPDIRTNEWYRFDDEFVTRVDYDDVIADAFGGSCSSQQKLIKKDTIETIDVPIPRPRVFFWRIFALLRLIRQATFIGSQASGAAPGFGYGGKTSNAYMLQYVKRCDIPKLWLF